MRAKLICTLLFLILVKQFTIANNIKTANVSLQDKDIVNDFLNIKFDLNWENSWRSTSAPSNWDAAWVFLKYRVGTGPWKHASLNNTGNSPGTGTPASIQVGLLDESIPFGLSTNPAIGAFIYRSADGSGTFSVSGARLRWNYGVDGVQDNDPVEVMIVAVEMVYVPAGDFFVGSGGQETGGFTKANSTSGNTVPFLITAGPITLQGNSASSSASNLSARDAAWDLTGTNTVPIPAAYPTGHAGFYCMKYEISQQQYVDFLNTLTGVQKNARYSSSMINRNGISSTGGVFSTTLPNVARNFMSWGDGRAYSDWSCLRPMTELEFEKACRGPVNPVPLEYAWGTASVTSNKYVLDNSGAANENITAATYSTTAGNAGWGATINSSALFGAFVNGPVRVGIFAGNPLNTSRITSGASYYGIMELSGNLLELCVSLGMSSTNPPPPSTPAAGIGRNFTGLHGNGSISAVGEGDVANWPATTPAGGTGIIFRGGAWNNFDNFMRTSDRNQAYGTNPISLAHSGYRAVRSLPVSAAE